MDLNSQSYQYSHFLMNYVFFQAIDEDAGTFGQVLYQIKSNRIGAPL